MVIIDSYASLPEGNWWVRYPVWGLLYLPGQIYEI